MFGEDRPPATKKQAAMRQISAAIFHLHTHQYECAITLAGAAEGMLGDVEPNHLWKVLMERRPQGRSEKEWVAMFNETRDWLKHTTSNLSDARHIDEFEAVVMLIRAVSKFTAGYDESSNDMEEFVLWCREHNYAPKYDEIGTRDERQAPI